MLASAGRSSRAFFLALLNHYYPGNVANMGIVSLCFKLGLIHAWGPGTDDDYRSEANSDEQAGLFSNCRRCGNYASLNEGMISATCTQEALSITVLENVI